MRVLQGVAWGIGLLVAAIFFTALILNIWECGAFGCGS